ncbi:hypothetical protein Taro_040552 [Colocasia esculenta]|uniref:Uncharacterized protein n=1 Tax=Colocasia esculenta TaxID=4460 RepID=A0A843WYN0_COLES|nr:hypothetical protein [Colocasia esculenta]
MFERRGVRMRSHREPAATLPEANLGARPQSLNPTFCRPGRSADSELGPSGRFRSPDEETSSSDRRGARSVY